MTRGDAVQDSGVGLDRELTLFEYGTCPDAARADWLYEHGHELQPYFKQRWLKRDFDGDGKPCVRAAGYVGVLPFSVEETSHLLLIAPKGCRENKRFGLVALPGAGGLGRRRNSAGRTRRLGRANRIAPISFVPRPPLRQPARGIVPARLPLVLPCRRGRAARLCPRPAQPAALRAFGGPGKAAHPAVPLGRVYGGQLGQSHPLGRGSTAEGRGGGVRSVTRPAWCGSRSGACFRGSVPSPSCRSRPRISASRALGACPVTTAAPSARRDCFSRAATCRERAAGCRRWSWTRRPPSSDLPKWWRRRRLPSDAWRHSPQQSYSFLTGRQPQPIKPDMVLSGPDGSVPRWATPNTRTCWNGRPTHGWEPRKKCFTRASNPPIGTSSTSTCDSSGASSGFFIVPFWNVDGFPCELLEDFRFSVSPCDGAVRVAVLALNLLKPLTEVKKEASERLRGWLS